MWTAANPCAAESVTPSALPPPNNDFVPEMDRFLACDATAATSGGAFCPFSRRGLAGACPPCLAAEDCKTVKNLGGSDS